MAPIGCITARFNSHVSIVKWRGVAVMETNDNSTGGVSGGHLECGVCYTVHLHADLCYSVSRVLSRTSLNHVFGVVLGAPPRSGLPE